jgi:hypothetical protein
MGHDRSGVKRRAKIRRRRKNEAGIQRAAERRAAEGQPAAKTAAKRAKPKPA